MNRAIIRRWINEYLDGEIGLADKVELERIMTDHPEVREEYGRLRRISLLPYNKFGEDKRRRFGLPGQDDRWVNGRPERVTEIARQLESHGYTVTIGG